MINSRKKGNSFELQVINELKSIYGENVHSTRSMNRVLDSQKVDICGDVPYNIQCKATETVPQVHKIFAEMNQDKPCLIWWKRNHKPQIVIMEAETFLQILLTLQENSLSL